MVDCATGLRKFKHFWATPGKSDYRRCPVCSVYQALAISLDKSRSLLHPPEFGKAALLPEEVPTHDATQKLIHQDIVEDDSAADDLSFGQL